MADAHSESDPNTGRSWLGAKRRRRSQPRAGGRSEAQIVRWVQFPAGALFFTLVPEDPESGAVYVFDRRNGVFYLVDFNDQKWGGYSLAEYEVLERTHRLTMLAQRPWLLERRYDRRIAS